MADAVLVVEDDELVKMTSEIVTISEARRKALLLVRDATLQEFNLLKPG